MCYSQIHRLHHHPLKHNGIKVSCSVALVCSLLLLVLTEKLLLHVGRDLHFQQVLHGSLWLIPNQYLPHTKTNIPPIALTDS